MCIRDSYSVAGSTSYPYLELTSGSVYLFYNSSNYISIQSGTVIIESGGVATEIIGNTLSTGILSAAEASVSQLSFSYYGTIWWGYGSFASSASAGYYTPPAYVAGYAIGLDITIRGTEDRSFRKSPDSYMVLGPWLVTADRCV